MRPVLLLLALPLLACGRSGVPAREQPAGVTEEVRVGSFGAVSVSEEDALVIRHAVTAASVGGGFAVAWLEYAAGDDQRSFAFATVDGAGRVQERNTRLTYVARTESVEDMQVFASPIGYIVFVDTESHLRAVVLDADGYLTDEYDVSDNHAYYEPYVFPAANGTFAVTYRRGVSSINQIHLQPLDAGGRRSGGVWVVDPGTDHRYDPEGAWTGDGYLVAWREYGDRTWLAKLDTAGMVVTPSVLVENTGERQTYPSLRSDGGGGYLVQWWESANLNYLFMRVDASGAPSWANSKALTETNRRTSPNTVVAGANGWLAAAWEADIDTVLSHVRFATVDAAQPAPAAGVILSDPRFTCWDPRIAMAPARLGVSFCCRAYGAQRVLLAQVEP